MQQQEQEADRPSADSTKYKGKVTVSSTQFAKPWTHHKTEDRIVAAGHTFAQEQGVDGYEPQRQKTDSLFDTPTSSPQGLGSRPHSR